MTYLSGYKLSIQADNDLNDIFDYTELEHGFDQAIIYLIGLEALFKNLVLNPKIGRERNEIKKGLYSITENYHVVFYRILKTHIRIVRVLHGRKDIPNQF
ncbi:type II toxin-antitoxin system RelE/ParE family toxin [Winogradskyella forsetii]|uniref:type II toxin-antitoxin system RelE/ParE family toxin n=1 Tax=Winogradskyella forsetii TaxID=2686077 RepID=UPI0015BE4D21|nr:type II toxin-antitoxin system RelE/ParE family toxin [Winogradskyella forsetii]